MEDKEILINNWLLKSDESFEDAKINIDNNRLSNAQNRVYYAVFYAVSALAQKLGFITSKHNQLRAWFNREFVKTKQVDNRYSKIYTKLFDNRHKSDYTFSFKPTKQTIQEELKEAQEFIQVIKQLIINKGEQHE
ncbi:MAG: hypothetical protein A2Y25_02270 [Candidatus Melainabacteria bacterium GWF2_37_15]|nr:MAG: hypothetical protein A2Y25_02270 [Candidatus Melainabacteria bacterium GWF2_37_15]